MIDETVRWLESMQPKHEDPPPEPVIFERDFGIGDEQREEYLPLDYEEFDAGHKPGDFC